LGVVCRQKLQATVYNKLHFSCFPTYTAVLATAHIWLVISHGSRVRACLTLHKLFTRGIKGLRCPCNGLDSACELLIECVEGQLNQSLPVLVLDVKIHLSCEAQAFEMADVEA